LAYAELGAMIRIPAASMFICAKRTAHWQDFSADGAVPGDAVGRNRHAGRGFAIYLSSFVPLSPLQAKLSSVMLIAVLSLANYRGVRLGAGVQRLFTFLKLTGLTVIVVSAFASPRHIEAAHTSIASAFSWSRFGVAMIACLWAYEGWNCVSFVAGEVKRPERNLPLALGLGLTALIAIYLTANVAYMRVMTVPAIAATERVAAASATLTLGPVGATLVSVTILLSIVGASNGSILTSSRIYFAQARDGLFFRAVGNVHPRFRTPHISILVQGIWRRCWPSAARMSACFLRGLHGLDLLRDDGLCRYCAAAQIPDLPRPYRMWGYPVTPLAFAAVAFWFVINTIIATPASSLIGLAIVASGVPVYYIWRRKTSSV